MFSLLAARLCTVTTNAASNLRAAAPYRSRTPLWNEAQWGTSSDSSVRNQLSLLGLGCVFLTQPRKGSSCEISDPGSPTAVPAKAFAPPTTNTIVFRPASECEAGALGCVVHFKGFGHRIDFDDAETKDWGECAVETMMKLSPDTVVWDGDSYHEDSFTKLLPIMHSRCKPTPRLVMFVRDADKDRSRVMEAWANIAFAGGPIAIDCYLAPAGIHFSELGRIALEATRSKEVLSLGGGPIVGAEFDSTPVDVSYHLVPAMRKGKAGNISEHSVLRNREASNLEVLSRI